MADVALVWPERVDPALAEPDLARLACRRPAISLSKVVLPQPEAEQGEQLTVADLEARAVHRGRGPEPFSRRAEPDLHLSARLGRQVRSARPQHRPQGFFQVASMSVRNFCLSASDRFVHACRTRDTSRSKSDQTRR